MRCAVDRHLELGVQQCRCRLCDRTRLLGAHRGLGPADRHRRGMVLRQLACGDVERRINISGVDVVAGSSR